MADLLARRLRCRVVLYGKREDTNEYNETTYDYAPIATLWAEILPKSGGIKTSDGEMQYIEYTHVLTIRANAAPKIDGDMYIMYGENRFDVTYAIPHYRYRDRIEIYVKEHRGDGNGI